MGVKWDDKLTPQLQQFERKVEQALVATGEFQATKATAWMKLNAPWTDQTGNARNGLHAFVQRAPGQSVTLVLSHGVNYGIWLEVKFNGRDAVVTPAIRKIGNDWQRQLRDLFREMERQR